MPFFGPRAQGRLLSLFSTKENIAALAIAPSGLSLNFSYKRPTAYGLMAFSASQYAAGSKLIVLTGALQMILLINQVIDRLSSVAPIHRLTHELRIGVAFKKREQIVR